jgi:hypothetical protein
VNTIQVVYENVGTVVKNYNWKSNKLIQRSFLKKLQLGTSS